MNCNVFTRGLWSILLMTGLLQAAPAQAHFVWVETDATASADKGQPVKVYFGEYAEFLREERGGRLDSIDGVTLRVQDPKRGKTDVPLTKQVNHFVGSVSSCVPGRNAVVAEQAKAPVQDLRKHDLGIVKPMFYARTYFVCLEESRVNEHERDQSTPLALDLIPLTTGLNLASGDPGSGRRDRCKSALQWATSTGDAGARACAQWMGQGAQNGCRWHCVLHAALAGPVCPGDDSCRKDSGRIRGDGL